MLVLFSLVSNSCNSQLGSCGKNTIRHSGFGAPTRDPFWFGVNWLENEILKVVDNIVPYKHIKPMYNHYSENTQTQRLVRKKRHLLNKWRLHRRLEDKKLANKLNKEIRKSLLDTKKKNVRRHIIHH